MGPISRGSIGSQKLLVNVKGSWSTPKTGMGLHMVDDPLTAFTDNRRSPEQAAMLGAAPKATVEVEEKWLGHYKIA